MKDLKVIFMGTPDFACPVLEYLIQNTNVVLVVTQPDKEIGRHHEISFSPIKKLAIENKIDVFQPVKIRNDFEIISEINPDIIITCAYGQIIPKSILDIPKLGCINVHASILPKYRGSAPIQWSIINGDKETGVTIMYMDEHMDTGDIIEFDKVTIEKDDDVETLHEKLSILGKDLLSRVLPKIVNGTNNRIKQDEEKATYAPMIKREDEKLDFNQTGESIINKIRALNPWPGTYFLLNDNEIKVIKASFIPQKNVKPNEVIITKKELSITCLDGLINLEIIKPFGKGKMNVDAFLNGMNKEEKYHVN